MIEKAFLFSNEVHGNQIRKDGKPYISHPVMVAMELAKNGADDNLICAGLLHDVIEDGSISKETLIHDFNEEIANLVDIDSEDKSLSWEERKLKVLHDASNGSRDYQMLLCADKLSNLKDVEEDIANRGEAIWKMFKRGKDQQAWFYHKLVEALQDLNDTQMYKELVQTVENVFGKEE